MTLDSDHTHGRVSLLGGVYSRMIHMRNSSLVGSHGSHNSRILGGSSHEYSHSRMILALGSKCTSLVEGSCISN